ncbi:ClpA/ClpB-like protein [Murinocardiopsis flavida]|uniref:ClpA/ClpB-like protein n=1 Tax=Murinocardiopsis flavida TaxID=645275 RepID=A0A2P8DUM9_9ACTN|nr:Clp protease N-terminal domain-containing protein [Murinocardiopsis flavida]PSL00923.1 ClpA/ClpB-like protein [Murinocardiopsis flavida]
MFERFTEEARAAVTGAQAQAVRLGHQRVRAGHLLLALIDDDAGAGARALRSAGADPGPLRSSAEEVLGAVDERRREGRGLLEKLRGGHIPFGGDTKTALKGALSAAVQRGQGDIGAAHLFLGVLTDETGTAVHALEEAGVDVPALHAAAESAADGG